jgi:nucleoside-diphosphate-sugar epimerase
MKRALVCGGGGFIGSHLVSRLKEEGYWVRAVDLKEPEFSTTKADEFIGGDLTDYGFCREVVSTGSFYDNVPKQYREQFDEIYQLAADMGGAGYIFTGENDAAVMQNSASINLNILKAVDELNRYVRSDWYHEARLEHVSYEPIDTKIFYSSSACMYPEHNQLDPENPNCEESSAYPANPDSEYGWEKLFSERLYLAYNRNRGIPVRIARFHNIYGPEGTWRGGREKAPAALCRKVAEIESGGTIDVWGDGKQTRSFLYIDECVEGIRRLMESDCTEPVNIGSDEMVSINDMVANLCIISKKGIGVKNILDAPTGVRGRNSDNKLIKEKIGWAPNYPLKKGLEKTYNWIKDQIDLDKQEA